MSYIKTTNPFLEIERGNVRYKQTTRRGMIQLETNLIEGLNALMILLEIEFNTVQNG